MLIGARLAERYPPYNVKIDEKFDDFRVEGGLSAPLFRSTRISGGSVSAGGQ